MASGDTEFTQGIKIIVSGYWWADGPGWVVVEKFVGILDEWRERPIAFNQGAFCRVKRRASLTATQLAGGPSWFRYLSPASTKDL